MITFDTAEEQEDPIKGGTSTKVDKTPLLEVNRLYIKERQDKYNERMTDFVTNAFSISGTLPKVGGKQVQNLNEIPSLVATYGNELYEQAKKVKTNPDIDDDNISILLAYEKKVDDNFAMLAQANNIIYSDMLNAAKHMDGKMKVSGWHTLILNDKGQLKGPTQAKKDIEAYKAAMIKQEFEAWKKANPVPERAPMYWQRTDMPNPMGNSFFRGPDGKIERIDSRPKMQNSIEGFLINRDAQLRIINNKYQNLNYDHVVKRVLEEYNKNSKTRRIKAAEEGVFNDNAGGAKQAVTKKEFIFDIDDAVDDDGQGNQKIKTEMTYAADLFKNVINNNNVFVVQGRPESNTKIPGSTDAAALKMLNVFYQDMQSQALNVNRQKGSNKRANGKITFTPLAGGDENFHSYHIQIPSASLQEYLGNKDNPGIAKGTDGKNHKFVSEGITVFVPVAESEKIMIGSQSLKGTKISPVEGMIALSADNSYRRLVDDAMDYKITLDKKTGQYYITGNVVAYNAKTAKMDTVNINELGFKSRYDLSVDIDKIDKDLFMIALKNYKINREHKREHSKLSGVRDPKQLAGN
jgi:hypothetical protein